METTGTKSRILSISRKKETLSLLDFIISFFLFLFLLLFLTLTFFYLLSLQKKSRAKVKSLKCENVFLKVRESFSIFDVGFSSRRFWFFSEAVFILQRRNSYYPVELEVTLLLGLPRSEHQTTFLFPIFFNAHLSIMRVAILKVCSYTTNENKKNKKHCSESVNNSLWPILKIYA